MKKETTTKSGPSDFQIFMNWAKDGNLNSPIPKDIERSKAIGIPFLLHYFNQSQKYFVIINEIYNNYDALKLSNLDVMYTFKQIIHYTRYSSFSKKKAKRDENPLIAILKEKFPYYKKEEILMAVDIIDKSEDKDVIYEMFGINNTAKVKKMTKAEIKEHKKKFEEKISKDDVLNLL